MSIPTLWLLHWQVLSWPHSLTRSCLHDLSEWMRSQYRSPCRNSCWRLRSNIEHRIASSRALLSVSLAMTRTLPSGVKKAFRSRSVLKLFGLSPIRANDTDISRSRRSYLMRPSSEVLKLSSYRWQKSNSVNEISCWMSDKFRTFTMRSSTSFPPKWAFPQHSEFLFHSTKIWNVITLIINWLYFLNLFHDNP